MSCDSWDSPKRNSDELYEKDSLTLYRLISVQGEEESDLCLWALKVSSVQLDSLPIVLSKYFTATAVENMHLGLMIRPWNRWGSLFTSRSFPNIAMVTKDYFSVIHAPLLLERCMW